MTARERALALVKRDLDPFELPDPPENLDFCELPEHVQDAIADRFACGVALTVARDSRAALEHRTHVATMRARRERFAKAHNAARVAERTRQRANKASLGERAGTREALAEAYLAAHRADNSGSGK